MNKNSLTKVKWFLFSALTAVITFKHTNHLIIIPIFIIILHKSSRQDSKNHSIFFLIVDI